MNEDKSGKYQTIIAAAEMAPGVIAVSSSRAASGRGPERRPRPGFPTEVGPRKIARRIFWVVTDQIKYNKHTDLR